MTPYECAQQIIHACAGNPERAPEAANAIQLLVSEAATELLSFHRRRSEQIENERDEWCATAANAKANEDAAIRDLSALRQELQETAAAYVAMREALRMARPLVQNFADGNEQIYDAVFAAITYPLPALAVRMEAERAELQAYRDAAEYDALMSGPVFKGWNRSQLDRARKLTEQNIASLSGDAGDEGNNEA